MTVLRQAGHQTVVLTAELKGGHLPREGVEHPIGTVRSRPGGRHHTSDACGLQGPGQRPTIQARSFAALSPGTGRLLPGGAHPLEGARHGELLPLAVGAAGGLGEVDEDVLAGHRLKESLPVRHAAHVGEQNGLALHRAAACSRTEGKDSSLQGAHPGLDEIHMTHPPGPAFPGAVVLHRGLEAPALEEVHRPGLGGVGLRRSGEPGTDDVEHLMRHGLQVGVIHGLVPDLLEDGIVHRHGLGCRRRGDHARRERGENEGSLHHHVHLGQLDVRQAHSPSWRGQSIDSGAEPGQEHA